MFIKILRIKNSEFGFGFAGGPFSLELGQVDCFPGVKSLLRLVLDHAASIDQTLFLLFFFFLYRLILAFDLSEALHSCNNFCLDLFSLDLDLPW
jgi:hypothetical protein